MRAFVFPGQGGGVSEPAPEMVPEIRRVVGERIPDQVKIFARAAQRRRREPYPGGASRRGGGALARRVRRGLRGRLLRLRDRPLARGPARSLSRRGRRRVSRRDGRHPQDGPRRGREGARRTEGPVVANYNSPRQTVVSGLRDALGDAVSKIRGRKIPLNVSFAAHSPYVAAAGEKMRGVLDSVEFRAPQVPIVSAMDGAVLTSAEAVKEARSRNRWSPPCAGSRSSRRWRR